MGVKAIIVAAGEGSRLLPHTHDKPKAMLDVCGNPILKWQLEAFESCGIKDVIVVRGYKKKKIRYRSLRYYDNPDYKDTNILESLMCARQEIEDEFVFSYSDILFTTGIVRKLLEERSDIALVVDRDWRKAYVGRTEHPTDEAELVFAEKGRVVKISKFMNPDNAYGEFIGLTKFSANGAEILKRTYDRVKNNRWCGFTPNQRFHDSSSLRVAYLTDMLQEIVDRGYFVHCVDIHGGWIEIDTPQDLEKARSSWALIWNGRVL